MARQYPSAYMQASAASSEKQRAIHDAFIFPPPLLQDQAAQSITCFSLQPLSKVEKRPVYFTDGEAKQPENLTLP